MKKYLIVLAVFILVIVAGYFYWQINKSYSNFKGEQTVSSTSPVACTEEAKVCPDGSYVVRQGENCQFAECPAIKVVPGTEDWQTYKNDEYGFEFKYPKNWSLSIGDSPKEITIRHYLDSTKKKFDGAIIFIIDRSEIFTGGEGSQLVKSEEVKIDGQIAERRIESWSTYSNENLSYQFNLRDISKSKISVRVYAYDGERGYSLNTYNNLLDKVMETFKFTK